VTTASPLGRPVDRIDGPLKVTGAARYAADHLPNGLAYGYLVTSTVGLGAIVAMDTAPALAAPGVVAVYTPFNPLKLHPYHRDENDEHTPPLQSAQVRYHGQVIGLVVAETFEQARDAAGLVTAEYDRGTPNVRFHGSPSDPVVEPGRVEKLAPGVASIDAALAGSDVTLHATYTSSINHHNPMEPHATVASWSADGDLTLHTTTQGVRLVVDRLAGTLGVAPSRVRVVNPYVGGAFGSKWGIWALTPLTAAAARELGRPVKTVLTREQLFTVVGHRPATAQAVSLGARRDGTLTAVRNLGVSSRSASSTFAEPVANYSLIAYRSPNLHTDRRTVTLDLPATTIMNAPHEANGSFALESAMDELAAALDLDPLALRRRNYATLVPHTGLPWSSKHLDECYDAGAALFGWQPRRSYLDGARTDGDWLVGTGLSGTGYHAGRGQAAVLARLHADGTATVGGTGADLGTGQATVFAILGADSLGIPIERVRARLGDSTLPPAANAGGSGSSATNGPAVRAAVRAVKRRLIHLAARAPGSPFHGLPRRKVHYGQGRFSARGVTVGFGELLTLLGRDSVEAVAASVPGDRTRHGFRSFGVHFCEVRVHRWTAEVRVTRWVSVVDAGRIISPKTARNQIVGGVVMGIGQALLEHTRPEPGTGRLTGANLGDYLVPVNADIPPIDVRFLDHPDTVLSPLGARGIGEIGIVGTAAAIANAVHHATGVRVRDLPITLESLLGAGGTTDTESH
jgi:xanthine dehydrogenase YagR molybdenum-binding subunit